MAAKKRPPARRTQSTRAIGTRAATGLKTVPNEIAARYRSGREEAVRDALSPLGRVESYLPQRMIVLHRASGITAAKLRAALDQLQRARLIEFVTPVLLDPDSRTRQVLTDEIVVRLKPGRSRRTLAALEAAHGIEIDRRNEFEPSQYIVKVPKPSGLQTLDVARSLDRSEDVEFASPNFLTEIKR